MILSICGVRTKMRPRKVILSLIVFALLWAFSLFAAPQSPVLAQEPPLVAPTGLSAQVIAEGVVLSWTAPAGTVDGYEILRRQPLEGEIQPTTLVDDTGSSATSYTDTTATAPGGRYAYRVRTIRGTERSDQSDFVRVDIPNTEIACDIMAGNQHDILQCTASYSDLTITSAGWTPSFEVQYFQETDGPEAHWVIADEYCGESTEVEVEPKAGDRILPTAVTTITLACSPPPAETLAVSCESSVAGNQHRLTCTLSGGDETITSAQWTPGFDAQNPVTTQGSNAAEAAWTIGADIICGETSSMTVVPEAGETTLAAVTTSFPLPCVIIVDDDCSLANAIRSANGDAQVEESDDSDGNDDCEAGASPDEIAVPPDTGDDIIVLTKNVTLAAPLPSLTSRIRIEGKGRAISGDATYHVFMVVDGHAEFNNVTITKGLAATVGGGIYVNNGSLRVRDSAITDSKANDIGGAIYAIDSDVDIADTTFNGNMTVKSHGGAIYFISSTGLHTMNIVGSTFQNNTASEDGGALKTAGGIVTINKSTFAGNTSDEGGAIEASQTNLDITNSTFSSNSAREGGGLSSFSSFVTLTHTTWAFNSAAEQGGGIAIIGWTGNFKIRNTLVSHSANGGDCDSGPNPNIIIEFTGNLIQDGSCTPVPVDKQAADDSDQVEAQLVILADAQASPNLDVMIVETLSGNPPHHRLIWGSPAIDHADPLYCLLDDQPDTNRPQYGNCDIGAFEYPRAPDPPPEEPEEPEDDPEPDDPPPPPAPPETPTPVPEPNICPVNDRIFVRSFDDDVECVEIDTVTIDKHPALEGIRFAMRLWRYRIDCVHVVSEEENLFRLAILYDTTVEVLRRHNNLSSDILSVGQLLLHPSCTTDATYFSPGTDVCFSTPGRLVFIDTATAERTVHTLDTYLSEGMTCGMVSHPGIVALVASDTG